MCHVIVRSGVAGKAARKSETPAGEIDLATCKDIRTADGKLFLEIEGRTCDRECFFALPPSTHDICLGVSS